MQTFYPGLYFKEVTFGGSSRPITGIDMSIGAMVGYFEKGPIGVPTLVTKANFASKFGGPITNGYGYYAMNGFFENGGNQLWVVRTAHYTDITAKSSLTAVTASLSMKDRATTPLDTLKVTAKEEGTFGRKIYISVADDNILDTLTTAAATAGATLIVVKSVYGIAVGDQLNVGSEVVTVAGVNPTTREITLQTGLVGAATIGTVVKTNEFKLVVTYKGVVETFNNLSMNALSARYVETIVNDSVSGSAFVVVDDLASATPYPKKNPAVITSVPLTGGDDGLTGITDADLIGALASKTGMYALSAVQDAFNLFIPESCSETVKRAMYQYCESRMDAFGIGSVPFGYDIASAISYRRETGNFNTSYGALYYLWGYVNDPIGAGTNPQKVVPLDGHIAGMYARHDAATNIGEVPAGETAVLFGVNKLERNIDDIDNGNINKVNINAIRSLSGAGIVVWGARTLSADPTWKYINRRRIFIYVEKSVATSTRWVVFKPSNSSTWKSIKRTVESFLNTVPGLYGDTPDKRYQVICDETINTAEVRSQGQILTKIGLNTEEVGEFIIFEVGQMSEGVSISE